MSKTRTWLKYNREGEIIEIIIRDAGGGKIETLKFRASDKKRQKFVISLLKSKYGIDLSEKQDKDIDWLKSDF